MDYVYPAPNTKRKDAKGQHKIAVILNEGQDSSKPSTSLKSSKLAPTAVPAEYKMLLQNTESKNLYVFGEKPEEVVKVPEDEDEDDDEPKKKKRRLTKMIGTVNHECQLMPSLTTDRDRQAYSSQMRFRQKKAAEPARTIKRLEVSQAEQNRMASGASLSTLKSRLSSNLVAVKPNSRNGTEGRAARMEKPDMLNILFERFEEKPYWAVKVIAEQYKQPQAFVRELLEEIGNQVPHGPYKGLWVLKDSHKPKKEEEDSKVAVPADEDNDEDDMEEVK